MKKGIVCLLTLIVSTSFYSCDKKDYSKYTVACMGDSITWGYDPATRGQLNEPYPVVLKKSLGFGHVSNYGVPTSTLCNNPDPTKGYAPMVDRIRSIDKNTNLVIIWGGINDYQRNCSFGNPGDTDSTNVYGALNTICDYLSRTYTNAFTMLITPLPVKWGNEKIYLNEVKDAVIYTGNKFKIPVLNLTENSGFETEIDAGLNDGIHPSQSFINQTLVPKIKSFIKSNL